MTKNLNEKKETQRKADRRRLLSLGALGAASLLIPKNVHAQEPTAKQQVSKAAPAEPVPSVDKTKGPPLEAFKFSAQPFSRSASEQKEWDRMRNIIRSDLRPTSDGTVTGSLSAFTRRIEAGFKFKAQDRDEDFSYLHVEPLLDQAADLLDRGLRDRAVWDEQSVKMLDLTLELSEYSELDEIHAEEERRGLYDVPWKQSKADHSAEALNARYQQINEDIIDRLIADYYNDTTINEQYNAARKAGWLTGCLVYSFQGQTFAGYQKHTYGGVEKDVADHALDAADKISLHQLFTQLRSLRLQKEVFDTLTEVSKQRLPGLEARSDWDTLNANFMRRRTIVARRYQDIKSKAATDVDGILNYQKRLGPLYDRFHSDFRHALARLFVVQKGLKLIYGYSEPFPADGQAVDYFDKCMIWTRSAIQWVIRFSRQDQSLAIPISLRQILGDDAYREGRKTGKWEIDLGDKFFAKLLHLRLRGLSVFVVGDDPLIGGNKAEDALWSFEIRAPLSAKINHVMGTSATLDQSSVPPCQLGRVTSRDSRREPDVVGSSALYNASPIGQWQVKVHGSIPAVDLDKLKDVHLDLHLTYRNPRAQK
jgi:hypothetical protein